MAKQAIWGTGEIRFDLEGDPENIIREI